MSHSSQELAQMPREKLVEIANTLKIKVHHKAKPETIIHQIMQQPVAYRNEAMSHPADATTAPVVTNTVEQVQTAIATYAAKEGFSATFPDDGTWVFSCKGASESGNLSIPLRIIKQKAESVSRGARVPPMLKGTKMMFA